MSLHQAMSQFKEVRGQAAVDVTQRETVTSGLGEATGSEHTANTVCRYSFICALN